MKIVSSQHFTTPCDLLISSASLVQNLSLPSGSKLVIPYEIQQWDKLLEDKPCKRALHTNIGSPEVLPFFHWRFRDLGRAVFLDCPDINHRVCVSCRKRADLNQGQRRMQDAGHAEKFTLTLRELIAICWKDDWNNEIQSQRGDRGSLCAPSPFLVPNSEHIAWHLERSRSKERKIWSASKNPWKVYWIGLIGIEWYELIFIPILRDQILKSRLSMSVHLIGLNI